MTENRINRRMLRNDISENMTKCVKVLQSKQKAKGMDQSQARIRVGTV